MTKMKISTFPTSLAWEFTHLIGGSFRRNKAQFAHHEYPILGPLPGRAASTEPLEKCTEPGPFLYFVVDGQGDVCYVGKSEETSVLKRWIRPGNGGPASHYWTHSTRAGGCVFSIADGLRRGSRYQLRYAPLGRLQLAGVVSRSCNLPEAERQLIDQLRPAWNANSAATVY